MKPSRFPGTALSYPPFRWLSSIQFLSDTSGGSISRHHDNIGGVLSITLLQIALQAVDLVLGALIGHKRLVDWT